MPQLRGFDLSESYILGWSAGEDLVFKMEFVLTPAHPSYHPPRPDEWACYERGRLRFPRVRNLSGLPDMESAPASTDASGERDFGNFDSLSEGPDGFLIEGDFGAAVIVSDPPQVELDL